MRIKLSDNAKLVTPGMEVLMKSCSCCRYYEHCENWIDKWKFIDKMLEADKRGFNIEVKIDCLNFKNRKDSN